MKTIIHIKGPLNVGKDIILKFYPDLRLLLREIREMGWSYSFSEVYGKASVIIDLDKVNFTLEYHPPEIEELEEKGTYEIRAEVGYEPPAVLRVEAIDKFEIYISSKNAWRCVRINPLEKTITYIKDVLWNGIRLDGKSPRKLSEAREVYQIVKFFLQKGYRMKNEYVLEKYKELVELFEKTYTFTLTLELTVHNEELVPGWNDLIRELGEFFYKKGLLMSIKENNKHKHFLFRKPLP